MHFWEKFCCLRPVQTGLFFLEMLMTGEQINRVDEDFIFSRGVLNLRGNLFASYIGINSSIFI